MSELLNLKQNITLVPGLMGKWFVREVGFDLANEMLDLLFGQSHMSQPQINKQERSMLLYNTGR